MDGRRAAAAILGFMLTVCTASARLEAQESNSSPPDYFRDIQPIFASRCIKCHGTGKSEGGLRLTDLASATKALESGARAVVPKQTDASELLRRVTISAADEQMPPKGPALTDQQVSRLKRWIAAGAVWPKHWALASLVRPRLPPIADEYRSWVRTPVDAFILEGLLRRRLEPAPEADKRRLLRRVYFDLIGLPPTPEEIYDFVEDRSPNAYETVVDRLLVSPRYGERWARHWLDVVHYADTHGHDEDAIRENAWPYRDYLIESLNSNKPYARFVQEQTAGDVLFPNDPSGIVAVGMLAAGPWDESSQMGIKDGTVDKEIARYLERDDMISTVMNTFVSMTVHCARCHDHKFDPIPTEDYYRLQAVFAGLDRVDRPYDLEATTMRNRRELLREKSNLQQQRLTSEELLRAGINERVAKWERSFWDTGGNWRTVQADTIESTGGATATKRDDGSILFSGKRPDTDIYKITTSVTMPRITAVRLEVMTDESLSNMGPGRQGNGNLHLSEFKLRATGDDGSAKTIELHRPVADFNQEGWTIAKALDGNPKSAWGIYPQTGRSHKAIFELKQPIDASAGVTLTFILEQLHGSVHLIGRPRLSVTGSPQPHLGVSVPVAVSEILSLDVDKRSDDQKSQLALHVLKVENALALAALPAQEMVYSVASDFPKNGNFVPAKKPRPVHVLRRGNVLSPIKPATPGSLSCVEGLDAQFKIENIEDEGERRAALARWVSDRENVLTWRSIVNRVWHYHFGRGIVGTPSDFGSNGSPPTHPQLLDWLAVTFRDGGGRLKDLHRLIVTSATYRQASRHDVRFAAVDQDNRYLWRMTRRRLDAEQVRDAILQISGRIDWKMGGPADRQFITGKGVHVTPTLDYEKFNIDSPAARRRSVYRFIFRTVPDPLMEALDCPDPSQFTPKRTTSTTSLQALAMLNNRFVVRYSGHIANRIEMQHKDRKAQIHRLFELAYGRPPTAKEAISVATYVEKHGLENACRVIVNSNEFMFVN
ncbi:MAG: PSD1 and planctomycete cytochrome C domain-containing protein [Pirellulales bacterium]